MMWFLLHQKAKTKLAVNQINRARNVFCVAIISSKELSYFFIHKYFLSIWASFNSLFYSSILWAIFSKLKLIKTRLETCLEAFMLIVERELLKDTEFQTMVSIMRIIEFLTGKSVLLQLLCWAELRFFPTLMLIYAWFVLSLFF